MPAVRAPSPLSSAPIPARTPPHSGVAEPEIVHPSQSTMQRTAWRTTPAGRSSNLIPAANAASARLTEWSSVTGPPQSVIRKEILLYRLHGNCTVGLRRPDLRRDTDPARLRDQHRRPRRARRGTA